MMSQMFSIAVVGLREVCTDEEDFETVNDSEKTNMVFTHSSCSYLLLSVSDYLLVSFQKDFNCSWTVRTSENEQWFISRSEFQVWFAPVDSVCND